MREKILAGITALALAGFVTTDATASSHASRSSGSHVKGHAGGIHNSGAKRGSRFALAHANSRHVGRSYSSQSGDSPYAEGGFIDLGPLGITAACGARNYKHGTCGSGYSVSGWSY